MQSLFKVHNFYITFSVGSIGLHALKLSEIFTSELHEIVPREISLRIIPAIVASMKTK